MRIQAQMYKLMLIKKNKPYKKELIDAIIKVIKDVVGRDDK